MLKKLITLLLSVFIFLNLYISTDCENYIQDNKYDESPFSIKKLIPNRGEQNVVSTPEIKISYSSTYNLDKFKLYLNYKDVTNKTIITSKYIYYKCEKKLKPGVQVVKLEVPLTSNDNQVTEWYFTVGSQFYNHYRGIFFNNTNDLNILTSYEDLNSLCKNDKHLDFLFITEGINYKKRNLDTSIDSKKYSKLIDCCNKYCNNGEFISIPGFELRNKLKNEKDDIKVNIFNCRNPFIFKDNISLELFYKKLFYYEDDLIGQFQSSNSLDNINYFKYSPYGDEIISLLELKKNSSDNNKNNLNLNAYKEALDNGWHISPIISKYNEYPNTDFSNIVTTTILCEELTKNQILDGIKNRRIYISESDNMDVYFSLNKLPMGSIIKNPSYVRIIVRGIANNEKDKIKKIEVFTNNNEIIYSKDFDSNFGKIDFTLKPPTKNTYYFALITDKNNKETVTSPIWIEH